MDEIITKKCTKCGLELELSFFGKNPRGRFGLHSACKKCTSVSNKKYWQENKQKLLMLNKEYVSKNKEKVQFKKKEYYARNKDILKEKRKDTVLQKREYHLHRTYGLNNSFYEEMSEKQGHVCAICKNPPTKRHLHVDHNHESGKVRGLLCENCNLALGFVKDNKSILEKMIIYLEES